MISFRKLFLPSPATLPPRMFQQERQQGARRRADSAFAEFVLKRAAMTPVQPVRGTQSLLGEDADRLAAVVAAFDRVRRLYGFKRVEVPTIEQTAVFARTIGETTDVVSKEMYSFEDRGGEVDHAAARVHRRHLPRLSERRLAAIRAAQGRDARLGVPLRTAAEGPLPRVPPARRRDHRRRRAAGRCRAARLRRPAAEGARDRAARSSSSTRSAIRRPARHGAMRCYEHFRGHASALSEDSQARLERNPLRILDSKAHQDWPVVDSAPAIDEFLTGEAADFFGKVTAGLDAAGVAVGARAAAGARPRLLPPHGVRVRHRPARRAGHGDRAAAATTA